MKNSWFAAIAVVVALVIWMVSGLFFREEVDSSPSAAHAGANKPMRVEVLVAEPVSEQRTLVLRGELAATRMVDVRAETSGRVTRLNVARGDRVGAADVLVGLDAGVREALLAGARAQLDSTRAEQRAAESLGRQGLQSQLRAEQTQAASSLAKAEVDRLARDLADTQIQAPFAGVVETLPLEIGQLVERGDLVARLVDDSAFVVTARAAQQVAAELRSGQPVEVTLITGEVLEGVVSWVSSVADTATRSFEIEARVRNSESTLAAGVSATLSVPVEEVEAVFLSSSTLTLGPDGELGVKVVDANDQVGFQAVTILRTSLDGAWVTGIDRGARIVTLGQGFVEVGQPVLMASPTEQARAES